MTGAKASALQSFALLDNPHSFVKDFFAKHALSFLPQKTSLLLCNIPPSWPETRSIHPDSRCRLRGLVQEGTL